MSVCTYGCCCHPGENDNFLYKRVELDHETEVTVHIDYTVKECVCVYVRVWSIVFRGDGRLLSGQTEGAVPFAESPPLLAPRQETRCGPSVVMVIMSFLILSLPC